MKVALCLSGQPRSFEAGYEYHKKNLLDHYNVDVYMHTWDYVDDRIKVRLSELYGGTLITHSAPPGGSKETINALYTNIPDERFPAWNTYCMLYSMWSSINACYLKNTQSHEKYDVIVRSRYDFALNMIPPLDETIVNKVYVPADRMTPYHDFCADMFAWGAPVPMLKYSGVFWNLSEFSKNVVFIGEDLLAAQLKRHGLIGKNMIYVDMNNPFPPGKYNGNWHSLIRDDFSSWNKLRDE